MCDGKTILRAEQSRAEQSRAEYIDIAKGIGIIIVIFCHLSKQGQLSRTLACSFVMPLFFLISGYLYHYKGMKSSLIRDAKKLLYPVFIVMLIDSSISILQCVIGMDPWPTGKDILYTIILYKGLWKNFPVWFLATLFVCRFLCDFSKDFTKCFVVAVISAMICIVGLNAEFPVYWLVTTLSAYPFFVTGYMIQKKDIKRIDKITLTVRNTVLVIMLWLIVSLVNGPVDMYQNNNGLSWILYYITGVTGTLSVIVVSKIISKRNTVEKEFMNIIGRHSLGILLTHYYFCRIVFPKLMRAINMQNICDGFLFQVAVTLCLAIFYYKVFKIIEGRKGCQ